MAEEHTPAATAATTESWWDFFNTEHDQPPPPPFTTTKNTAETLSWGEEFQRKAAYTCDFENDGMEYGHMHMDENEHEHEIMGAFQFTPPNEPNETNEDDDDDECVYNTPPTPQKKRKLDDNSKTDKTGKTNKKHKTQNKTQNKPKSTIAFRQSTTLHLDATYRVVRNTLGMKWHQKMADLKQLDPYATDTPKAERYNNKAGTPYGKTIQKTPYDWIMNGSLKQTEVNFQARTITRPEWYTDAVLEQKTVYGHRLSRMCFHTTTYITAKISPEKVPTDIGTEAQKLTSPPEPVKQKYAPQYIRKLWETANELTGAEFHAVTILRITATAPAVVSQTRLTQDPSSILIVPLTNDEYYRLVPETYSSHSKRYAMEQPIESKEFATIHTNRGDAIFIDAKTAESWTPCRMNSNMRTATGLAIFHAWQGDHVNTQ